MTYRPTSASDSQVAALDRLARAAQGLQPGVLPDGLWHEVLHLPTWWLVAEQVEGGISPLVAPIEGARALFAFSTRKRAEDFIAEHGLRGDGMATVATGAAPAYVVDRSPIYHQGGATIILFDCDDVGYFAPIDRLHHLWRRFHGDWVHRCFDEIPEPVPAPPAGNAEG